MPGCLVSEGPPEPGRLPAVGSRTESDPARFVPARPTFYGTPGGAVSDTQRETGVVE